MRYSVAFALTFAGATQAYLINGDNVNCRSGPNTGSSIVRTYNKGHDVTLTCQTHGESINNDSLWDKTTDGCYVADWYVETHTGNMVVGECNAKAYPINGDNVNCRSGANTQSSVVRQYNKGDMVTLTCQTEGESINNDKLWDKTTDNCYVADWYVQTNTGSMVVGACNGGGNPPPPTGGNLPTLNSVQSRNANGIIAEVKRRNLGRQGCLAAITTGLTESSIRILANNAVPSSLNYAHDGLGSDHDSVGIFQQRAKYYTNIQCDMTADCSAGLFLAKMAGISGWQTMDVATLCQKVQVSAVPDAYKKYTSQAGTICSAAGF
ncbi:hypothetical protein VHEMI07239 [[Torrubiella] hemipterigena]|uniref:Ig-like domain-containing protein n=1 Tax=[Torrubiella] hemipterigena TaxID=1531966 RepID=A0A0A1TMJ0_9HYPO|nr:hypothetical protein VHEMI07239 [[Torrubiella] hemipterigena]